MVINGIPCIFNLITSTLKMKRTLTITVILLIFSLGITARSSRNEVDFTDLTVQEALHEAMATGKGVFVFFEMPGCRQCKWMLERQFVNKEIGLLYNQYFISVQLNLKKEEVQEIAMEYGITQHHALLFLNAKGSVLGVSYGPLDDHQILEYGREMMKENIWYTGFKRRITTRDYTLADLQKFLFLDKDYPDAEELLDDKIMKVKDKEFFTLQTLESIEAFYSDVNLPSFQKLLDSKKDFVAHAEVPYYNCVHTVYLKYYTDHYPDTGKWKSNIDSVKNEIAQDAMTDYIFKMYNDSLRSFKDKSYNIKWKRADRDSAVYRYSVFTKYWIDVREPSSEQLREEIIAQCDAEFYGYDRLQNLTRDMIRKLYVTEEHKYLAYHTDSYFNKAIGNTTQAKGLLAKAIHDIKENDPYNIQMLRFYQHQLQEME